MTSADGPSVFLVGAGPGDPGMLTLRAVECLRAADIVLYDKLVPDRVLDFAGVTAERVCVRELSATGSDEPSAAVAAMIAYVRAGKRVARLKGGDPLIFGRGGEEAAQLRDAGIDYEIVPGITAGIAAAATTEIPLTHRAHASAIAFVTGHDNPDRPQSTLDWAALASFPGTLIIYMGFARLDRIVAVLMEHGKAADTACSIVTWASTGYQESAQCSLVDLPRVVRDAGLFAPAVLFVGPIVAHRPELSWFERRPLHGMRVLVTRPSGQEAEFVRRLELLGATPFHLPVIEIRPPDDWSLVDRELARLDEYSWIAFTSANGVHRFLGRLLSSDRDLRALGGVKLAAVGPATARALADYRLNADLIADPHHAEALANALIPVAGNRVLLPRGDRGRDLLAERLRPVTEVVSVVVYRQVDVPNLHGPLLDSLRRGEIDYVTVTSPNIARGLLRQLDETGRHRISIGDLRIVAISELTAAAVQEEGLGVAATASVATDDGLIAALVGDAACRRG